MLRNVPKLLTPTEALDQAVAMVKIFLGVVVLLPLYSNFGLMKEVTF